MSPLRFAVFVVVAFGSRVGRCLTRLGMDLVTTTGGPQLLEGTEVDVIVDAVAGRDGGCLISMAEAIILSVEGEPPSRTVCVSYPSWRPDLHIALVSAQQYPNWLARALPLGMCMSAAHSSHLSPHTPRSQLGEKVEVLQDVQGTASEGQDEQWCPATVVSPPKSGSSLRVRLYGDDKASGCALCQLQHHDTSRSLAAPHDLALALTQCFTRAGRSVPGTGGGRAARSTARRL